MPGTVIGKDLNLGYIGKVSRNMPRVITSRLVKSILNGSGVETLPEIKFGDPVVLNTDNTYSKFGASGTGVAAATLANFAGFAVAEVKQGFAYGLGTVSNSTGYVGTQAADVLSEGAMTILCAEGTPTAGGKVYIVSAKAAVDPVREIGDIVAVAEPEDGATVIELTNCRWTTGKIDSNKVAEVSILTRNNP